MYVTKVLLTAQLFQMMMCFRGPLWHRFFFSPLKQITKSSTFCELNYNQLANKDKGQGILFLIPVSNYFFSEAKA